MKGRNTIFVRIWRDGQINGLFFVEKKKAVNKNDALMTFNGCLIKYERDNISQKKWRKNME